ncbi:DUF1810 domain-containing protein [uncultured Legionella sp.]|uniref:DUF1810 domain-containing protein n=1 Tax=uncultured Legionella sp. TaxID=210934 RepID=UPI00263155A0|nr:DUF1810 family protein [uncultured Legionella sp.]
MNLDRFHKAQKSHSGHEQAKKELQNGKKTSHWIWYIFPQLESLGFSDTAKYYGIKDRDEACAYLKDPILFQRYFQLVQLVEQQVQKIPLTTLMGGNVDAQKLMSSLTLFRNAATHLNKTPGQSNHDFKGLEQSCARIFKLTANQGYYPCQKTLSALSHSVKSPDVPKPIIPEVSGSFFQTKKMPLTDRSHSLIRQELAEYQNLRKNEWSFHYNFMGVFSVLYFIQDMLLGTDHFNSKSREVKINASSKLEQLMDTGHTSTIVFSEAEKKALQDGRLGSIVNKHGGLEKLVREAASKQADRFSAPDFKI